MTMYDEFFEELDECDYAGLSRKREYSPSTERLLSILGRGSDRAVGRNLLAKLMNTNDSGMRKAVCLARLEGVAINNDQNGDGYYLPDTLEELKRQYAQTEHRAKILLAQLKAIRNQIATLEENQGLRILQETGYGA